MISSVVFIESKFNISSIEVVLMAPVSEEVLEVF